MSRQDEHVLQYEDLSIILKNTKNKMQSTVEPLNHWNWEPACGTESNEVSEETFPPTKLEKNQ